MLETGLVDWTRDSQPDSMTDTILAGDLLLRLGLGDTLEAQLGWTAYGHVRTWDRATGLVTRRTSTGDISLALRQNLLHPDGSHTALAVMPFVTLPTGGAAIGTGSWTAGMLVPVSFELPAGLALALTPEVDDAADQNDDHHHLAFGSVIGLSGSLTPQISATAELSGFRDEDPAGHRTEYLAGVSLTWQPRDDLQLDMGANLGLDRAAPGTELYFGIARRF
jgi:hypothetical protein